MNPAAVLSIMVKAQGIQAAVGDLDRLDSKAKRTFDNVEKSTSRSSRAFKVAGAAAVGMTAAVGGGLVVGLGKAVSAAADFEAQLDALGSVSGATAAQMETLRKSAMKAGADTKFSALEAAQAQTELAKGGLKLKDILGGGLNGALALAAAGEMELADAASTTANALNLFGLKGKDAGKVADALATAANATTADVSDFAIALTQGGAAAKAVGFTMTDTVAALEALAAAGVKGSDAGTSLKSAFTQIASPTDKAAETMKKLGLNFFDSQGEMKKLPAIAGMLQDKLGGLTRQQRVSAITTIAGTDGMRTLLSMYDAGPKRMQGYLDGLTKEGTAAQVAADKQDNLKGRLEALKGSLETLGIMVGTKLIPPLTAAAEWTTKFINQLGSGEGTIGRVSAWIRGAADTIGAFAARVRETFSGGDESATGSVTKFANNARTLFTLVVGAVTALGQKISAVFSGEGGIGHDLAIIGRAFLTLESVASSVILAIARRTLPIIIGVIQNLATVVRGVVRVIAGILSGDFRKAWEGAKDIASGAIGALVTVVKGLAGLVLEAAKAAGSAIARGIVSGLDGLGHMLLEKVKDALSWVGGNLPGPAGVLGKIIKDKTGDGIGKTLGSPLPSGTFGGNLMGANAALGPFASAASRFGLRVSSGRRPGSITSSGNVSYHSSGEAIDIAGNSQGMAGFFRQAKSKWGSRLAELIYTGPGGGVGVKNGRPFTYGGQVAADHRDHVHLALDLGKPGVGDGIGRTGRLGAFMGDGIGDIRALWTRAGGSAGVQNLAAAVAMAESGGNPSASNRNSDGSIDRGLWQINSIHGSKSTFDRMGNARAAVSISSNGRNWNPWTVFKSGAYKRFLTSGGSSGPGKGKATGTTQGGKLPKITPAFYDAPAGPSEESTRAQAFVNAQKGLTATKPLKGGGPTKGISQELADARDAAANAPYVSPFAAALKGLGASAALAALTPDLADDIAAATEIRSIRGGELELAKQSGDPDRIIEAATNFKAAIDAVDQLTEAVTAQTAAIEEQRKSFERLIAEDYRNQFNVSQSQYGVLAQAITDVVSGRLGGTLGLGLSGLRAPAGAVART